MSRNSNRRIRGIAIISAAASVAAYVPLAAAQQVWVNPNTGNWNNAANWTGGIPASSNSTTLTFNATGAQTYTATNDIANPFLLNAMTFNNSGTGQINVAGNQLSFGGTNPAINISGSGLSTLSNNIQSTTAGVPLTYGGAGTGTVNLSGGGTLYALNGAGGGAINMTGGTLVLTSTNRRNDNAPNPPINDGFWSFNIGDTAGQTSRFTQTGGTLDAQHGMVAVQPNSTGFATFTGNTSVATFSNAVQARFGINAGAGTWTVENGARVTGTFFEVGRQANSTANAFVTGGGTLNAVTQVLFSRFAGGNGSMTINSGGNVTNGGNSFMSPVTGSNSTLSISGAGSRFANTGVFISSGGSLVAGGVSRINVSNGGQFTSQSFTFVQDDGGNSNVTVDGPGSAISSQGIGAGTGSWALGVGPTSIATLNVNNGATASAPGGAMFLGGGIVDGVGDPIPSGTVSFNVTGAGGNTSVVNVGFMQMGQSPGSVATLNVNTTSTVNVGTNLIVGLDPTGRATVNASGANAVINAPGFSAPFPGSGPLGDPIPGGNGTVNITNGGRLNMNSFGASIANNPDAVGTVLVSGTNSRIIGTGTAQLVVGGAGTARLDITSGGAFDTSGVSAGNGNAFFGADVGGNSTTTVNAGTLAIGGQLQLGGSGGDDGSPSVLNSSNGAVVTSGGLAVVYTTGTLNIGAGTSAARFSVANDVAVDGNILYNAGTFSATGTLAVGGNVLLSSAARNAAGTPSNKKLLEVGQATLTTSGVIDLNDNDMLIHDTTVGARQKYETFVKNARNNGAWDQPGITSTAAKNSVPQNKNLGVISGAEFQSANGGAGALYNGRTVAGTDTLIKFTFNGDTDLNGVVNFDDYARTDSGFNNNRTGWFNGDFDYNGVVNFDDYGLIDLAFNTQAGQVLSVGGDLAGPGLDRSIVTVAKLGADDLTVMGLAQGAMSQAVAMDGTAGGQLQAVPEPASIGLFGLATLGAFCRRRRTSQR